jgi:uncharacterized protein YjlB
MDIYGWQFSWTFSNVFHFFHWKQSTKDFVEKVCHRATTEMLGSPGGDIFVAS